MHSVNETTAKLVVCQTLFLSKEPPSRDLYPDPNYNFLLANSISNNYCLHKSKVVRVHKRWMTDLESGEHTSFKLLAMADCR